MRDGLVTMFLCGDVMLGRGIDQILPYPADPTLWEAFVRDARTYVELAEAVNGPIPRPVDFSWMWLAQVFLGVEVRLEGQLLIVPGRGRV